jgi:hypothetical protein
MTTMAFGGVAAVSIVFLVGCASAYEQPATGGCNDSLIQWVSVNDNHKVDEQLNGDGAATVGSELFDASTTATCAFSGLDGAATAAAFVSDETGAGDTFAATQAQFESDGYYVASEGSDPLTGQTVTLMLDGADGPAGGSLVTIQNLTGDLITDSFGMSETTRVVFVQRSAVGS